MRERVGGRNRWQGNGFEPSWTTAGRAVRKTGSLPEPVAHYSHRTTSSTECSCGLPDAQRHKSSWRERKERYLAHLRAAEGEGILVSACDKLANLQAILFDLTEIGESVWARFSGGKGGSLWYYTALVDAFGGRVPAAMEAALQRDLAAVLELAEVKNRVA